MTTFELRPSAALALLLFTGAPTTLAQQPPASPRPPIIDMHIHAFSWNHMGNPPPAYPITEKVPGARTDAEAMEASLAELRRYNVVKAVAGGRPEHVARWHAAGAARSSAMPWGTRRSWRRCSSGTPSCAST